MTSDPTEQAVNYIEINKQSWNNRTHYHVKSDFYENEHFIKTGKSLNEIELSLLGDIKGKKILHLQCHFGQDSISLSKMGAHVTGIDLSEIAINYAQELANKMDVNIQFICCNIYDLPLYLDEKFDLIFTSYGVISWLPDLDKWAQIIAQFLKPNGQFLMVEFHPVVWMFDDNFRDVAYNYFNDGPLIEQETGTYADRNAPLKQEYVNWNHSIDEVVSSLIGQKLNIAAIKEYNYSPYNCFANTVKIADKKYQIAHLGNRIPMVYAVLASI